MAFSREFLEEIKLRNNIEDVIGHAVTLKRAGGNLSGLCPFHSEKTPSFTVFPSTQSYYCFGCGAGGDVVTFVMQTENLEYRDAIIYLAKRAGIKVEETLEPLPTGEKAVRRERIVEINKAAAKFFYKSFLAPEGAEARAYIGDKRRFTSVTVKRFGIGYAPAGAYGVNPLCDHLSSLGFTPLEIKTAFLGAESKKNGKLYDIFRNRIMFPIFDANGDIVAFSGRRLNENDERKYVNTSDTPAFKKSKVLFGLNIAKNSETGNFILCEGAPDAIAMHQAGFDNAIATLGTAITPEHARTIARYTRMVYLAYDIDKAGRKATLKGIELLNQVGVDTKIINLGSDTKDPDEFIKAHGADAFRAKLNSSAGQIDYRIDEILSRHDLSVAEEKLRAVGEITSFIATFSNRPQREVYAERAADKLGLTAKSLRDEIEKIYSRSMAKARAERGKEAIREQNGYGSASANPDKIRYSSEAAHEEAILGILLIRPDYGIEAVKKLTEDDFATVLNKKIFVLFKDELAEGREVVLSKDGVLTPKEISALERCRASRLEVGNVTKDALDSHIEALKNLRKRSEYDKKIESDPLGALTEYLNLKKKNKDKDNQEEN